MGAYHFPINDTDDTRLCSVKDNVVDFVVAMYKRASIFWLRRLIPKKRNHIIIMRQHPHLLPRLLIFNFRLINLQPLKRLQLPIVKPPMPTKILHPHRTRLDAVEFRQRRANALPHFRALVRRNVRDGGVFKDAALQERHDVEGCADYVAVGAETHCARDGDVGGFHGVDDAVFAVHLMGGFGEEFAWWLFSHDEFLAIAGFEEVGWVGLAVAELLDVQRRFDFWDILLDVFGEVVKVDRLSYGACHCVFATVALDLK